MSNSDFKWKYIQDLPENWKDLQNDTLKSLPETWQQNKNDLSEETKKHFLERLQREWAIETGLIENLYTLGQGDHSNSY